MRVPLLFLSVLAIAVSGLVYELLAGTLASYVLGDSVTQFSLVIGIYLSAMGAGAYLAKFIDRGLARWFVEIELTLGLVGGVSAPLLFFCFGLLRWFHPALYGVVFLIGVLVGLELPLLLRLLQGRIEFKDLVSKVLAFDYVGALVASLLFPLFCVPYLGLVRTSLAFGILNALVGLWGTWILRDEIGGGVRHLRARAGIVLALLAVGFAAADQLTARAESHLFADEVIHARTTAHQRMVVTRGASGFQLFLNGNLQFNSADEYRYHEALVHPAMASVDAPRRVVILGGGDGLAVREVLRHPSVVSVTLVDLDPGMTSLAREFPLLTQLNGRSLHDPRVTIVNEDAMLWIARPGPAADVILVDFPDPNTFSLGKLYTTRFYRLLQERLAPGGAVAVQCTSPLFAQQSYWCIVETLEASGLRVRPYQAAVPSFGVWGYALAKREDFPVPTKTIAGLRFLDPRALAGLFEFPLDMARVPSEVNRLDNQVLVRYYESDWRRFE